MTSKILLRIASVIMCIRFIAQITVPYHIPREPIVPQQYLWQSNDLAHNHEFFFWGFSIVFIVMSRLLWLLSNASVKQGSDITPFLDPVFFLLLAIGIEEIIYHYYYTGTLTLITAGIIAIAYIKMKGISIKIMYNQNQE